MTDHLFLDLADRKVKVRESLEVILGRGRVVFRNNIVAVTVVKVGRQLLAEIDGERFIVEKFHVSFQTYPLIRAALK